MELLALLAALVSVIVYLTLGIVLGKKTQVLSDHLPVMRGRLARVANSSEFSASTVAATISLATVVMAFFELAPYFGLWLLWTVITTTIGIFVVRVAAKKILERMSVYKEHRPTLHEFLGYEYNSSSLSLIGAICTSLGFLGAFAVELTVGSRFLSNLIPSIPPFILVIVLALVALVYTAAGGFRAVIVTDRIQMKAIWALLIALSIFYIVYLSTNDASVTFAKIPPEVFNFSWREGLGAFLVGIFIINVPTFLSDMSVWQRIAGTQDNKSVFSGLWRSVIEVGVTWALFVILACLVYVIITPTTTENPLLTVLHAIYNEYQIFGAFVLFAVVLGLYGAMFSTASTQLVAVSHTIHMDIIRRNKRETDEAVRTSATEVRVSRIIICVSAVIAMVIVEILSAVGFSIADLVFAIYGAQLGLFPATLAALLLPRDRLKNLASWALTAIAFGFIAGWGCAGYGKFIADANLVFLAPAASLLISSVILALGIGYNQFYLKEI